ncbi:MAG: isoprenylcysteine carboxylmethyltransferase family protein [Bacteroidota bacterium]|nr:isoprenylcysteine carboxylmethyltransferase family protein [Bacteroidota bacterium]
MDNKERELTQQEKNSLVKKIIIRFSLLPIFIGLLILLPAGTFNYWQVYLYLVVIVIPMLFVLLYFYRNNPKFLERRIRTKEREKQQKIIQLIFSIFFFSGYVISGFDKRFGWSNISTNIVIIADIFVLLGYIMVFFVFKQNSYASRIVEVEKNQKVITSGLYKYVRHPMYTGIIIMFSPTSIALGSYWGLISMATIPVALILRLLNEEKVLCKELPGYKDYCQTTKYRLIPFIW